MHHDTPIEKALRLTAPHKKALEKLGIKTLRDLLYHFPSRYDNISEIRAIATLNPGDDAIVYGKISKLGTRKTWKSRMAVAEGVITDQSGSMKVMWFHQPFIAKLIHDGADVKLGGKVTGSEKGMYLANPEIETVGELPIDSHDSLFGNGESAETFYPIYPETKGITSQWFRHAIRKILGSGILDGIIDPIPTAILDRYHLPTLQTALVWLHAPKKVDDATAARKRFAFEEVFLIQVAKQRERELYRNQPSLPIHVNRALANDFVKRFPFEPTDAQKKAIETIFTDFETKYPMARLLEGDVGSGKTLVAAATVYAVTTTNPPKQDFGNLQTAYMCPTEILAKQHFESFIQYFAHLPIQIGLITGSGCKKFPSKSDPTKATDISRAQLLKWIANGEIPILIGTHALVQKSVKFKNLAYVIIDEQHRFGTNQRQHLVRKDEIAPHLLSMTATPIPRTLALTLYGDLDLTLLDQMPKGRKPVITEIVPPTEREKMYAKMREEIKVGRQAYVICPRINEPDPTKEMALNAKSVTEEAKRLKKDVFQDLSIGILHGKMTPKEKDAVMEKFSSGAIDILVATSVVEVGVNVPNATVIAIEGAERYGLAQLHQLRGRVIRSNDQAYCFAIPESGGKKTVDRLNALKTAKNGFELAEYDLAIRGAGELAGRSQSGLSDLAMDAIKNLKMVEAARSEAGDIVREDVTLSKYPLLLERAIATAGGIHFE
jgi:ATP-dependent DNA helicase RecG